MIRYNVVRMVYRLYISMNLDYTISHTNQILNFYLWKYLKKLHGEIH